MNTLLRSLIVWLVLLAVPFQGFASAAMLACGAGHAMLPAVAPAAEPHGAAHHAPQHVAGHDHAAMVHGSHAIGSDAGPGAQDASSHGNAHSCSACSACSIGAAIPPNLLPTLTMHAAPLLSVPFAGGHIPSVHLALPERPPRPLLA